MNDELQRDLLSAIPKGEKNAILSRDLQRVWGMNNKRSVSAQVEKFRKAGVLICSGERGYYIPETTEELEKFYLNYRKMAVSLLTVLKPCRKELKKRGITYDRKGKRKEMN